MVTGGGWPVDMQRERFAISRSNATFDTSRLAAT